MTFDQNSRTGILLLLGAGALGGLLAGLFFLPAPSSPNLGASLGCGRGGGPAGSPAPHLRPLGPLAVINDWIYEVNGLSPEGALFLIS